MKKIMTIAAALVLSAAAFAQEVGDRVMRVHTVDGETTSLLVNQIKNIHFEEITPLNMNIEVSNVKSDQMDIDFQMPEGCKHWLMCMTTEEITGTDLEVRQAIRAKYNDDFTEAKFLRIPNLQPETTYYIYALLFGADNVVAGMAKAQATTQAEVKDAFTINVSDVAQTSATISFVPKDPTLKYYYFVVPEASREMMINQYGSIPAADKDYLSYCAESANYDLDFYLQQVLVSGSITKDARDITQTNLTPNTKYYAYCYGMNTRGEATTDVYEQMFTTLDVTPSENVISCTVTQTYKDGCDVNVTTTNDDPYLLQIQTKEVWDRYLSNNNGDAKAAATEIIRLAYGDSAAAYTFVGNYTGKLETHSSDTDCVVIACGYNAGVTTDVQTVEFKTLAE